MGGRVMRAQVESLLMWRANEKGDAPFAGVRWLFKGLAVRVHPHLRVRYVPVVRHLREVADEDTRVLEVGAGSLGITRYWRHPVTGVDIDFKGPRLGYLQPVEASAEDLPFADDSFDIVVSVDMLEHLTTEQREKAVREMLRVSAGEVLIGIPCGEAARECERWARERCRAAAVLAEQDEERAARIRQRSAFLAEHAECGLPSRDDIVELAGAWAEEYGRTVDVETFANEPIWFWRLMLPSVVTFGTARSALSHAVGVVLQPLLPFLPQQPAYRTFFLARKRLPEAPGV